MDYILKATAANSSIRIFIASTKETVQKAFEIHKTSPVMSAALGRTLTAAAIMGSTLKNDGDLVTISIRGDGPGGGVTVTSDSKSRVKGYCINNYVDIPLNSKGKLDVSGAVGKGTLTVIKDMGLKEPYTGQIPLVSGEIAEDMTYYYAKSEQTPSAMGLGVLVDRDFSIKQAGGFLIQLLPNTEDIIAGALEDKVNSIKSITELFEKNMSPEDILEYIAGEFNPKITDKVPIEYYCNCSREKTEKALISLGKKELLSILKEDGKANLHCHFCNKDYLFNEDDIVKLTEQLK